MSRVIQHLEDEHRFVYEHKGAIAYLDYEPKGAVMAITHTWVPPELAGQGIAADLTRAALQAAQAAQWQVAPICSYTQGYLKKHPEYKQLLKKTDICASD